MYWVGKNMEELKLNLEKENVKDLYDTYIRILAVIEDLNNSKKELPPKEEL